MSEPQPWWIHSRQVRLDHGWMRELIETNAPRLQLPWNQRLTRDTFAAWVVIAWNPDAADATFARWYLAARYHGR